MNTIEESIKKFLKKKRVVYNKKPLKLGSIVKRNKDGSIGVLSEWNIDGDYFEYVYNEFLMDKKGNINHLGGEAWIPQEEFTLISEPTVESLALLTLCSEVEDEGEY